MTLFAKFNSIEIYFFKLWLFQCTSNVSWYIDTNTVWCSNETFFGRKSLSASYRLIFELIREWSITRRRDQTFDETVHAVLKLWKHECNVSVEFYVSHYLEQYSFLGISYRFIFARLFLIFGKIVVSLRTY